MNLCLASINFGTFPINTAVTLTFESMADGSISTATGTSTGAGNLTLLAAALPSFVAGVRYKVTASHTWTGFECAIIQFGLVQDVDGIVTGAVNTVTACS
jgi:hypothetical protein